MAFWVAAAAFLAIFACDGSAQRWQAASAWGKCSASCGGNGLSHRTVTCIDETTQKRLPWKSCFDKNLEQPISLRLCGFVDCPATLEYRQGPCTHTCGGGMVVPLKECLQRKGDGVLHQVPLTECAHITEPVPRAVPCNEQACPPRYVFSRFSACSVTCGRGSQTRQVTCRQRRGFRDLSVARSKCEEVHGLVTDRRDCTLQAVCPGNYVWDASEWSQCKPSCEHDRQVRCYSKSAKDFVADTLCNTASRPPSREKCVHNAGMYVWQASTYGACTKTCGGGTQDRTVSCVEKSTGNPAAGCPECLKPSTRRSCGVFACPGARSGIGCYDAGHCGVVRMNPGLLCPNVLYQETCCHTCYSFLNSSGKK